jgi:hypothetical protein
MKDNNIKEKGSEIINLIEKDLVKRIKLILLETSNETISNKDAETILLKIGMKHLSKIF